MKFNRHHFRAASACAAAFLLFPGEASAYLDPGNGSFVFQIILGAVLTLALSFRAAWSKIVAMVRNVFRSGPRVGSDN